MHKGHYGFYGRIQSTRSRTPKHRVSPLPLTKEQVTDLVELITAETVKKQRIEFDMLANRVNQGVDDGAHVKRPFYTKCSRSSQSLLTNGNDINSNNHKIVAIHPQEKWSEVTIVETFDHS